MPGRVNYRWQLCGAGGACRTIAGATAATLLLGPGTRPAGRCGSRNRHLRRHRRHERVEAGRRPAALRPPCSGGCAVVPSGCDRERVVRDRRLDRSGHASRQTDRRPPPAPLRRRGVVRARGRLGFRVGDAERAVASGGSILVPRGTPHTLLEPDRRAEPLPARDDAADPPADRGPPLGRSLRLRTRSSRSTTPSCSSRPGRLRRARRRRRRAAPGPGLLAGERRA